MRISILRGDHVEATVDFYPDTHPATNGPIEAVEIDHIRSRLALGEQQGSLEDGRSWLVDLTWRDPAI